MKKIQLVGLAIAMASAEPAMAGGLLTNTNQHAAFNRMMSREASIGIDGVYYNPAGVAFMSEGHHLALNWQLAFQSRTIDNTYPLFAGNVNQAGSTERRYKGTAFAPVIPSIQYAYNKGRFSFQGNFALTGGGGKCTFDNGLGSFEKIVAETAAGACQLAGALDGALGQQMFSSDAMFGSKGQYSYTSYMHGRQYYYGLSLGAAYRMTDNLSVYAGVRGVYALCNYYGYVENIQVGNVPLYQVLDPSKTEAANIELSCDQSGVGFTPMVAADFKLGRWNFSAKYEFKTRVRLKNKSVNQAPSIGNLASNLSTQMVNGITKTLVAQGMDQATAQTVATAKTQAVLSDATVQGSMLAIKNQFDTKLDEAIGEYADGKKIAGDIPALLTIGAGYSPVDQLRINVGFHWFDDKHATSYNNRNKKLKSGTYEYNAGVEYDACKLVTVSAGWQSTNYGLSDEYMDDKSFVVNSNSVACGGVLHLSDKMSLNVAYFHTFYGHKKTSQAQTLAGTAVGNYTADYTRNNNVFAVGLDIDF